MTHNKRKTSNSPRINFTENTAFVGKRDEFLSNNHNKQQIINILSNKLREIDVQSMQCEGDADVEIALAAVSSARNQQTTLIGEDTDLLILLLFHAPNDLPGKRLFFRSDKEIKSGNYSYDIGLCKKALGPELCELLLFLHAFTGCDTTSRINGIAKGQLFKN